ncbi:MAG: hypothetical protein R3B13_35250 [Polyangiaceae bacterium]
MTLLRRLAAVVCGLGLLGLARSAQAQDPYGPGVAPGLGPPTSGPPAGGGGPQPGKRPPGAPETHAAGGGESLLPPSSEPSLPEDPLKIPRRVRARIGTDFLLEDEPRGLTPPAERKFYGPWYEERQGKYEFKLAFPVWAQRTQPSKTRPNVTDRASLFGGLYYNRRSAERADDVLFPLFWNLRDLSEGSRTTIIGPFVNRVAKDERDNWLAPLYFTGKRKNGGYTLIPPLLTYTKTDGHSGFNMIGPLFCSWEGGSHCDPRTAHDLDMGVFPFYFYGQTDTKKYEAIPPLLHYYHYDDDKQRYLNIWGPYYREHNPKRDMFHLLPLYWSIWGQNERHTTVLPFFHYGYKGRSSLFVNPLYLLAKGDEGETTLVTWGYARHRGRTELDMITPFYWAYRDPDIGLDQKLLFPFLYSRTSPRESNQMFFPFWAHFERYGVSETTWITPFFQHTTDLRGWQTNIHPILYLGRSGHQSHTVVAPFFWDFVGRDSRATVGFPVYWRFADRDSVSQLVGNVYYHERKVKNGLDWEVHLFPAFSYGETPDGHWWNVLYGLAGYTRRGKAASMRTLWIPIQLSDQDGQ